MTTTQAAEAPELRDPSGGGGLIDVLRQRYLLKLLVRKEVKVRYQGSLLGMGWSYIQPLTRFFVYLVIIGVVLGLNRSVPNFPVHIVAGLVMVTYFNETFSSTTRSVIKNKSLVGIITRSDILDFILSGGVLKPAQAQRKPSESTKRAAKNSVRRR